MKQIKPGRRAKPPSRNNRKERNNRTKRVVVFLGVRMVSRMHTAGETLGTP
jgi:hypothetical protein